MKKLILILIVVQVILFLIFGAIGIIKAYIKYELGYSDTNDDVVYDESNVKYFLKDDGTYLAIIEGEEQITSFKLPATRNDKSLTEVEIGRNVT